jgi:hypothetical protein
MNAEVVPAAEVDTRVLVAAHAATPQVMPVSSQAGIPSDAQTGTSDKRMLQWTLGTLLFFLALQITFDSRFSQRVRRSLLALEVLAGYFVLLV